MNTTKTGVLFDLDGVLVDSEGEYSVFWGGMGDRYGLPSTFSADIKGTTLGEILLSFPEKDRDGIVKALHEFEDRMLYPVYPGVMEFLTELRANGIPSAIVTSSDDVKMGFLFSRHPELKDMVDFIVTGSMVSNSKPHPEGYLKGAELIGRDPADCFVFEDSMQGLEAGRRSGATVVGIATPNPREKVEKTAHKTIDGFAGFTLDDMLAISRP